jgi:hypothetical protein
MAVVNTQSTYVNGIATFFRNVTLNALGIERDFYQLMEDKDVHHALNMCEDNSADVENALSEYNPQLHKVMRTPNKYPSGRSPYITCKHPRTRQRYINEVELFFLLGSPIKWKKESGDEDAYKLFTKFIKDSRFNTTIRKAKRLAGAETECAKLYHISRDPRTNEVHWQVVVLSRSTGYLLRPLFDQFGNLVAFAYGFKRKNAFGKTVQCWGVQTAEIIYDCEKATLGWNVKQYPNPTGKINVIYYKQQKAWDGAEPRIDREEELDSKIGDTNNYFADPVLMGTADAIKSIYSPETRGKLVRLSGEKSRLEYLNPPQASGLRKEEKDDLKESILFDTFTPDFSIEKMKGFGTLTGKAIRNAMILGYIKRSKNIETYEELVDREKNVIIELLKFLHPEMATKLSELEISFEFGEPFSDDEQANWAAIANLYKAGLLSLETAVIMLSLAKAPEEEIDRIRMQQIEQTLDGEEAKTEKAQETGNANVEDEEESESVA